MGWTFYNSSGQRLSSSMTSIANIDIDGGTDIGAAIVDADLFIVDDGAGGTNRKTAASRIKTYAGTTQAVQSDIEAETNQDTYVPPDLMKYHPGVAKAWCHFINTTVNASHNVTDITDNAVGNWDVNIATSFSSANYSTSVNSHRSDATRPSGQLDQQVADRARVVVFDDSDPGVLIDPTSVMFTAWGDQ